MSTDDVTNIAEPEAAGCPMLSDYNPLLPDELHNPYPSLRRARAEAPVFYSPEFDMWSITRQADVLAVLRDNDNFSASRALPLPTPPEEVQADLPFYPWKGGVLMLDQPEHRPARTLIHAPFTPRSLKAGEPEIRIRANALLDRLEEQGRIEFVKEYAFPLSQATLGLIIGVPEDDFEMLTRAVDASFRVLSAGITGASHDDLVKASKEIAEIVDYVGNLIERRRADPQDDYTSIMLGLPYADGSYPTTTELTARLFDLLLAGFETSAQMMAHGVAAILQHPDQWEKLVNDPTLVDDAVEEMLRYRTLVKRIFRVAVRDVAVGGVTIPEGALVAMVLASANHDEAAYVNPDQFDIQRGRVEHLAFGKWMHFCVGAPLARQQMRITLETLIDRFPNVRLARGREVDGPPDIRIHTIAGLGLELGRPVAPA